MMMVAPISPQASSNPQASPFRRRVVMERNLAEMHPAYFGLVMATGIVSIASHLLGLTWISRSAKRSSCASLMRFSHSPQAQ